MPRVNEDNSFSPMNVHIIHSPALCSQMVAVVLRPLVQDPCPEGVPSPEEVASPEGVAFPGGVACPEGAALPEGVEHILEGVEHILEGVEHILEGAEHILEGEGLGDKWVEHIVVGEHWDTHPERKYHTVP